MEQKKKIDCPHNFMWGIDKFAAIGLLALAALDVFIWSEITLVAPAGQPRVYFLDVGQGDAELVVFPGNIKVLTDAGPNQKIIQELEKILPPTDRYIDLAVISHPQLDHFNGFNFLADRYRFGAFIFNGRNDSPAVSEWSALAGKIKSEKIPLIVLKAGDKIRYQESRIDILTPPPEFLQSAELNDTGLVEMVSSGSLKTLLTADIGFNVEDYLLRNFGDKLQADILKIAHHGSKYSSGDEFLKSTRPKIAVIEVGANNKYGHPAKETLERLSMSTSTRIFRTDQDGTIKIIAENNILKVFVLK